MVNIILDTNTWLYLANGYDQAKSSFQGDLHFKLMNDISDLIKRKKIRLFVNDIIISEWKRNKDATLQRIKSLNANLKNAIDSLKGIKERISQDQKDNADKVLASYETSILTEIKKNEEHILAVEDLLFNRSINIPIEDKFKIEAANLALEKKAPFHNKNNSVADAVILLSTVEYFKEAQYDWIDNTIFVSNNSDDYCIKKGSKEIHPDLKPYFGEASIGFELNIAKALNLSQNIINQIDEYNDYLESINPCLASCKGEEYGTAIVIYNEKYIKEQEGFEKHHFNPDQLQLNLGKDYVINPSDLQRRYEDSNKTILVGHCQHCGAKHVRCICLEEHYTYDDDVDITCSCGIDIHIDSKGELDISNAISELDFDNLNADL